MSIQLLLFSQPITNSYVSYPSSQSVRFMKFFFSDSFSFLIYLSNLSFREKVDADLWASLSAGWDQSECCFSLMWHVNRRGPIRNRLPPLRIDNCKRCHTYCSNEEPALARFVLQARECKWAQETRRNRIVSLHNAGCWIANCCWSFKQNVQREWTAFKPTIIYGSCGLQYITGEEVDGVREREKRADDGVQTETSVHHKQ